MKKNAWLMVLIIFTLISVFWSEIPGTSFNRWIRELQAILAAFVVVSESSPREAMESILRRTAYVLIPFSLLLIKYFPEFGVSYGRWSGGQMWIGVTTHKNGLGRLCLIVVFFLIWSLVTRWKRHRTPAWKYEIHTDIFILILALWLMRGPAGDTYSATSISALVVGLLVYGGFLLSKKHKISLGAGTLMAIVAIIIIFGIVAVFTGGSNVGFFASTAGRDTTLTGRTAIWAALLPVAMQRPFLGGGFGSFWTSRTKEVFGEVEAHNGYLEVLLETGFVGILLISIFLLSSCRKAHHELSKDFDWGTLWSCYLVMAVVHNITEASINSFTNQLIAVVLFFSVFSTDIFRSTDKNVGV
jgi:O-antigen ligase